MFNLIAGIWNKYDGFKAVLAVIGVLIGYLGIVFAIMCLQAWAVMLVWNWVAVTMFGVSALTFWSSFGVIFLFHLITTGLRVKVTVS